MKKLLFLVSMLSAGHLQAAATVYTFESLTGGGANLAGQDGWVHDGGAAFVVTTDGLANGTQVAGTNGSGSSNFIKRVNDGNFSFGDLAGATSILLGFDGRFAGGGSDQIHFSLRNAANSAVSPIFGFEGNNLRIAGTFASLPAGIDPNDWVRFQMLIDMVSGTSSLSYQNITDGDSGFTAVTGLQNISTPGLNPSLWTEMLVRTGFYANSKFDNLSIEAVPEPSRALLALAGISGVLLRRRRLVTAA